MKSPFLFLVTAVLLLTGCNQPAEADSVSGGGGTIEAINHTHWAINHFSVNGQSGVDIIYRPVARRRRCWLLWCASKMGTGNDSKSRVGNRRSFNRWLSRIRSLG